MYRVYPENWGRRRLVCSAAYRVCQVDREGADGCLFPTLGAWESWESETQTQARWSYWDGRYRDDNLGSEWAMRWSGQAPVMTREKQA